jgi:hypothetical protein
MNTRETIMAAERPIFVVGVHRSGTTLLRFMLNSNPRLYIPPESDFIPRFFGRDPHGALSQRRVAQLLDGIFARYRLVKEWQGMPPDPEEFAAEMSEATPAAFLDTLYSRYAHQKGAERWGDKTPIYASYMDLLAAIFPTAQFVHIIRDGRDVALSMLDKWGDKEFHVDLYFAARNWRRRIHHAQASGAALGPERYYEMRYEALVEDPERELRPLCQFLGEAYLPEMAQPQHLGRRQIAAGDFHAPLREPPSASRVGRWRREMAAADLRLFQRVTGGLLAELGYELADTGPMPAGEIWRMTLLALKYEALQAGRRVLQAAGLVPPI